MPKTRQQKENIVQSLIDGLKASKGAVFANLQGLKVSEVEELRRNCRKENVAVLAAKKTLLKRAFASLNVEAVDPQSYDGSVAAFMGAGEEIAPAKIVHGFAKTHEVVQIFGGLLEGKYIDAQGVKSLAILPGRKELLAKVVGSLNAPVAGFVNVLAGNLRALVNVLNNIKEAKA